MDFKDFIAGKEDDGRRLDKVLRIIIPGQNLSNLYKSLRKGLIKVNGKKAEPSYKICVNDKITVAMVLLEESGQKGQTQLQADFSHIKELIIFENEHFLILNKPAGMLVQKAKKDEPALDDYVKAYLDSQGNDNGLSFRSGPLHRIDKNTCGLVCFSKSLEGAKWFSQELKNNNIKKEYLAVVQGAFEQSQEWTDYISKNQNDGGFQTVKVKDAPGDDAKIAITKVEPVKTEEFKGQTISYVKFEIKTGRHHQIRAQSAFHGFPLFGDTAYGGLKSDFNNGNYYLCACRLEFPKNELGLPPILSLRT